MRIAVASDVERARVVALELARALGFGPITAECVAIATLELATNLMRYADGGELRIGKVTDPRVGLVLESEDHGPGIPDLRAARREGFTTGSGMGSGLGSVERLMDESEFASSTAGTRIVARKWVDPR